MAPSRADIRIEAMTAEAWPAVHRIYCEGIETGEATFEARPPESWEAWCAHRIPGCSLVACKTDEVCGWAALSPVSERCVCGGVAELSVYVAANHRRRGIAGALLDALVETAEGNGIWTLQAGVFPENETSRRLFERHGFRLVGRRERLGRMSYGRYARRWRDVLLLERRSRRVGID